MKGNFARDVMQEHILTNIFHDMFFTEYLDKKCGYKSYLIDYNKEPEKQLKGIDVVVENSKNQTVNIDLKCQTNKYINNPTSTFCIEVSYIHKKIDKKGWFVSKNMETDYYLFIWIHRADCDDFVLERDELKDVEFMLVKKEDIKNYLLANGFNDDGLLEQAQRMRKCNIKKEIVNNIRFVCSTYLPEQPVNVVIPKHEYKRMPQTKHYFFEHNKMVQMS